MKKNLLLSLALPGVLTFAMPVMAQVHGGGAGAGSMGTPPTLPSQTAPNAGPGMNGPTGRNVPDGTMPSSKMDDKKFVKEAALGGLTEVQLGKLAAQKASRDDVKQFGQKMVDDHTKANDQLKEIASKDGVTVPDALDAKHQARVEKLSKLSGPEFDKAYVKDQLKDHETDVKEFQTEAQNGTDPNIKSFASSTLPILQEHLTMVKSLSQSEKNSSK